MSGQYVNPIGTELYGLQGLGGVQASPQGYYGSRTPVGLDADTFENSKPKKPDRLLLKWFNKNDSFLKAGINSITAAVGGVGNYFRSMVWSKEEGFFRGLKTAGCIVGFTVAAGAGMLIAPTFTAAALAGLTAFGVAAGGTRLLWSGLKWTGNMFNGKYDHAVEAAHDAGEAGIDVATNLVGARQATNAVMRMTDRTGATSNNPFNVLRVFGDLWETVGSRNFLRNGVTEARLGFSNFKSRIRLYSEHPEVVRSFETLQQQHQQVDQNNPITTLRKVFDVNGNRVTDNPIQAPNANMTFHSSYQVERAGKAPQRFMRVKVELGPEDVNGLSKSNRQHQTRYYDVMLDDMPGHSAYRIQRNKVRNGNYYENDYYQLNEGRGFTFDPNGQQSEFFIGRMLEGTANLFGNAGRSIANNLWRPLQRRTRGYTFNDIGNRMVENDAIAVRTFNPTQALDDRRALQTFTAREIEASTFKNIPYDGEIQPTMLDRLGGLGRALWGFSDDSGFHAGLLRNPQILRASNIARSNGVSGEEAQVVTRALMRHHGHLTNPEVFLYRPGTAAGRRQYLVRANGNDYIMNFEVNNYGALEPLAQTRISGQLNDNSAQFLGSALHESQTNANSSLWGRTRNWWLNRSENNRPVYSIQTVPANPADPTRVAVNTFITGEANAMNTANTILTMDSNIISTGILGTRISKASSVKINIDDDEADDTEKTASEKEKEQKRYQNSAQFNPFSTNYASYYQGKANG